MSFVKEILKRIIVTLVVMSGSLELGVQISQFITWIGYEWLGNFLQPVLFLVLMWYVLGLFKFKRL